jgi:MOSC domain-containing protein
MEIGRITQLYCYPVKSMAGARLESASLGWHGIEGDRRFAFRRMEDQGGFPWLTASRLPELLLYTPCNQAESSPTGSRDPTHVRTPAGRELSLQSRELQDEISLKNGSAVELMQLNHGIFDEAPVSIINRTTILEIEREAGRVLDLRRFRSNIVIEASNAEPFAEDKWLGKSLAFGSEKNGPTVSITMRDLRCVMINFDPDTAAADDKVMKAAVRLNANHAGAYGTVTRTGELAIGQTVYLS